MKRILLILVCCILALSITACGTPKLKNGEEVVATINGKKFTADDLYKELKSGQGYNTLMGMIDKYISRQEIEVTKEIEEYAQSSVDYYKAIAEMYSVDLGTLLSQYGLTGITTEKQFYDYMLDEYLVSLAIRKQVGTTFTDKDIEKYYNENYSEKLTVRHILIEIADSDTDGSKALKQANDLIAELKKTEKGKIEEKFIELAKEYSDDGSYADGGLISGFMSGTVVKEFWAASSKLKDGEYTTKAVKTQYGYHIIYRVSQEAKPALKDSRTAIIESLTDALLDSDETAPYKAMVELRKKYKLNIYDKDIKSEYDTFVKGLNG